MKKYLSEKNTVFLPKHIMVFNGQDEFDTTFSINSIFSDDPQTVVWIQLLPAHNDETAFWQMFSGAFHRYDQKLDKQLNLMNFPGTKKETDDCIACFHQFAAVSKKRTVALNHFHNLKEGAVKQFLLQLIEQTAGEISYILLSEEEVEHTASGPYHYFSLVDRNIQFTLEDIQIYYQGNNILIKEGLLEQIMALTKGWSVLVYLLGLCLPKGRFFTPEEIKDAVFRVQTVFEENYFEPLPQDLKKALISLSFLENFSPDLVLAAATIDNDGLISIFNKFPLIRSNPMDLTYYFHPLFLQFLVKKQYLLPQEDKNSFLTKAAKWYEEKADYAASMKCYCIIKDYTNMEIMLANMDVGLQYMQKKPELSEQLRQIALKIPEADLKKHPMLYLYVLLLHITGRAEDLGLEKLEQYMHDLQHKKRTEAEEKALGELFIYFGFYFVRQGSQKFVEYFKEAAALLPQGSSIWTGKTVDYMENGSSIMKPPGDALVWKDAFFEAAPYIPQLFGNWGRGIHLLVAAECHYYRGDFDEAAQYARECIQSSVKYQQYDLGGIASNILLHISLWNGEPKGVEYYRHYIRLFVTGKVKNEFPVLPDMADFHICCTTNNMDEAPEWIKEPFDFSLAKRMVNLGPEPLCRALYLFITGQHLMALTFIDAVIGGYPRSRQWIPLIYLLILKAAIYAGMGQAEQACHQFRKAYQKTYAANIIMPFVEFGEITCMLIQMVREAPEEKEYFDSGWLDKIESMALQYTKAAGKFQEFYSETHHKAELSNFKLTPREQEAFQLLCRGKTNREIAVIMSINVASVQVMLSRIYKKIGAANRADAIRIGMNH